MIEIRYLTRATIGSEVDNHVLIVCNPGGRCVLRGPRTIAAGGKHWTPPPVATMDSAFQASRIWAIEHGIRLICVLDVEP